MAKQLAFWLEELGREHHLQVGRKCANLGEMRRLGLNVPPGFALSVEAYSEFMRLSGAAAELKEKLRHLGDEPLKLEQIGALSQEIRRIVESRSMPGRLAETILQYYRGLSSRCGVPQAAVAARSAGPTSRPGQYETCLNVSGEEELLTHITKVWGSTFNSQSLTYRQRQGLPLESDPIGVAVIKMVQARSAGVAFTADPNSGDRSCVTIEANWGLGESVVSGTATPDVFLVDKANLEIKEKKLGLKPLAVVAEARGVKQVQAPAEKRAAYSLSDDEARRIAILARKLEEHFQTPQDVEWAIDEDRRLADGLYLLQSRSEVIAGNKTAVDQIVDLMLSRFPGGQP